MGLKTRIWASRGRTDGEEDGGEISPKCESIGLGPKKGQSKGDSDLKGPHKEPPKLWAQNGKKLRGIQFVPCNPSVTLTHQPLQSSVEYNVQVGNEKFGSMVISPFGTAV